MARFQTIKPFDRPGAELRPVPVDELYHKNIEAQNNLRTIELYKSIVENEPSAIIGIDMAKMIVLFNQGATKLLGDQMQGAVFSSIDTLELEKLLPDFDDVLDTVLNKLEPQEKIGSSDNHFFIYPLFDGEVARGAIIRISQ